MPSLEKKTELPLDGFAQALAAVYAAAYTAERTGLERSVYSAREAGRDAMSDFASLLYVELDQ